MWKMNFVTRLEYRGGYAYWICFDDGLEGEVDFENCLDTGTIFEPLRELGLFRQARIDGETIAWPNGADIAPETLYEMVGNSKSASAQSTSHSDT